MSLETALPEFDFVERHATEVAAPIALVDPIVRAIDARESWIIRTLFRIRSLGTNKLGLNREELLKEGFVLLEERPGEEIVLGLTGKFWTLTGDIRKMQPAEFVPFVEPGWAKAAWNFRIEALGENRTRVSTETRIRCTDDLSRKRFRRYWWLIRPFSGLVRLELLRAIRRRAERQG